MAPNSPSGKSKPLGGPLQQASLQVQVLGAPGQRLSAFLGPEQGRMLSRKLSFGTGSSLPSASFPLPGLLWQLMEIAPAAWRAPGVVRWLLSTTCLFPSPVASLPTPLPSTQLFFSPPGDADSCNNSDGQVSRRAALLILGSLTLRKGPLSSDRPTPSPNPLQPSAATPVLWDTVSPGMGIRRPGILAQLCCVLAGLAPHLCQIGMMI